MGIAVTQAGWTHKGFVYSLFVAAIGLAFSAIYWEQIREARPGIGSWASAIAGSSISWFTLLLVGFGAVFVLDLLARIGWFKKSRPLSGGVEGIAPRSEVADSTSPIPSPPKDKLFVDVDPTYLMAFYENRTSVQGDQLAQNYIGKWIKISGNVGNASAKWGSIIATVRLPGIGHILLCFDPKWKERVSLLMSGQNVTAIGEIMQVAEDSITLEHCELIDRTLPFA